jgi:hypothetical protein
MDSNCSAGNKTCKGSAHVKLTDPNKDRPISFVIATNKSDLKHGKDLLRGQKVYDQVDFSNQ